MTDYNKINGQRLAEGQVFNVTETIDPSDIMLYLGVTRDRNPLYDVKRDGDLMESIVPPILLMGLITRTISNHFPGPGTFVKDLSLSIFRQIHPLDTLTFVFTLDHLDQRGSGNISVTASTTTGINVLNATVDVDLPAECLGGESHGS
ncbi:enoyl-CoA hydratase [Atopobacter sp. AH10]|uniref:enoyl-CoA hydratase n=1 Tax=Atopobacter sp. AH10 TaxID=2315861 RepID=UPI000EF1D1C3|nr:enoyl-CoA hydratase [Atopobacter sp. AH10]RLK64131.1 enoyl-CoA hydratase [Atopobacter sp. AH10]